MRDSIKAFGLRQLRHATGLILALATLALLASWLWSAHLLRESLLNEAEREARDAVALNILFMKNPGTMTKEMHQVKTFEGQMLGHITSLKAMDTNNGPDPWEAAALQSFEQGRTQAVYLERNPPRPFVRVMKPMVAETVCIDCHANYHVGDIRGGISVKVPLTPYLASAQNRLGHITWTHAGLWVLGILSILLGYQQIRRRIQLQLQAEAALRESEERYRAVVGDQTELISRFRADGTFTFVSEVYCRFFGKAAAELLGKKWQPDGFSEDLPHIEEKLRALSPSNPVVVIENQVYSADGQVHWMQFFNRGFFDPQGRLTEIQSVGRDITERKKLEAVSERLAAIVASSEDAIIGKDLNGIITSWNEGAARMFGYTAAEMVGTSIRRLIPEEHLPEEDEILAKIRRGESVQHFESVRQAGDGRLINVSVTASPIKDAAGKIIGVSKTARDITGRKQSESERERLIAELETALARVKVLGGMLPICASCKKIRDDKDYWHSVESYVQKHSEATFTHGLCPDCSKKYFPGYEDEPADPKPA